MKIVITDGKTGAEIFSKELSREKTDAVIDFIEQRHYKEEKIRKKFSNTVKYMRTLFDTQESYVCVIDKDEIVDGNMKFLQELQFDSVEELFESIHSFKMIDENGERKKLYFENSDEWLDYLLKNLTCVNRVELNSGKKKFNFAVNLFSMLYQSGVSDAEYEKNNFLVLYLKDISKELLTEKIISEQESMVSHNLKVQSIKEIIKNISHHWKQPLNLLSLKIGAFQERYSEGELGEEEFKSFSKEVTSILLGMSDIVDKFKHFFTEDSEKKEIEVTEAINEVVRIVEDTIYDKDVSLTINSNGNYWAVCYENEFKNTIFNIVSIARDAVAVFASDKKKITVDVNGDEESLIIRISENSAFLASRYKKSLEPVSSERSKAVINATRLIIEKKLNGSFDIKDGEKGSIYTIKIPQRAGHDR